MNNFKVKIAKENWTGMSMSSHKKKMEEGGEDGLFFVALAKGRGG